MWVLVLMAGTVLGLVLSAIFWQRHDSQRVLVLKYRLNQARIPLQRSIIKFQEEYNESRHNRSGN